jgi:hypothetical protein
VRKIKQKKSFASIDFLISALRCSIIMHEARFSYNTFKVKKEIIVFEDKRNLFLCMHDKMSDKREQFQDFFQRFADCCFGCEF